MSFPLNIYVFALLSSAAVTALCLPLWKAWCQRTGTVDDPGHRKIHSSPIPLAGGLAVTTGMLVPLLVGGALIALCAERLAGFPLFNSGTATALSYGFTHRTSQLAAICAGALGMLFLGFLDDRVELRAAIKFAGQLLVALVVASAGVRITLFVHNPLFSYAITILWILTVVNAFNFMDNMNGLCAGLGAIGAFLFGVIAAVHGQYLVGAIAFLITGALCGFLPFNFPKASVFLGDGGSHLVGYLMAVLAILPDFYTTQNPDPHFWAVLSPLLVLALPLGDLVWVVLIRWHMGKPFYIGDNNHLSHRLVRRGWSQTRAVLFIWSLALLLGLIATVLM